MLRLKLLENDNQKRWFFWFLVICVVWLLYEILELQISSWLVGSGHIQIKKGVKRISSVTYFFLVTILYPLIEESIFRLPLRAQLSNIVASLLAAIWFFLFRSELNQLSLNPTAIVDIRLLIGLFICLLLVFAQTKGYLDFILKQLRRVGLIWMSIVSTFLFTLSHFDKILYDSWKFGVLFFLVVYFIPGLFLCFVRLRYNFWVALLFHFLNNSLPYLILLYSSLVRGENLFIYL